MAYIEFKNVNKYFGKNHVLKNTNLVIERGSFVTLLGASGCGKSTILRCLAGLESVSSGEIFLDNQNITHWAPKDRKIGMVFQQYNLFPNLNVFDNIAFGLKIQKLGRAEIDKRVRTVLEMIELEGKETQYPRQLSGGQQQRVALARSIVAQPKTLLLDEPLSAIDAKLRRSLQERIKEIHKKLQLTTIFVTHDQDEAMVMSDVIHLFNKGVIEQSDEPIDLYISPKTPFTAGFIGDYNLLTPTQFLAVTGQPAGTLVAIRPETIEITPTPAATNEGAYQFRGNIKQYIPKGNVLRYCVDVNGVEIKADTLFQSCNLYKCDAEVHLSVAKNNCLQLA